MGETENSQGMDENGQGMERRRFLALAGGGLGAAALLGGSGILAGCGSDVGTFNPATGKNVFELSGSLRWGCMSLPGLPYLDEVQPMIDQFTAATPITKHMVSHMVCAH